MKIKIALLLSILLTCLLINGYSNPPKNPDGLYKFTGKLNGKIPVFIWFVVKDSVLKGEVTYLKTVKKIPITVIGQIVNPGASAVRSKTPGPFAIINEFDRNGLVTGIYQGEFSPDNFKGHWYATNSEKDLPFDMAKKDTAINNADTNLAPVSINGSYEYHFGKNRPDGGVDIKQVKPNAVTVKINMNTAAPAYNVAIVEPLQAPINGNTIICKLPECDCKFRIRVFKNFLAIDLLNNLTDFGWGFNASVEGIYYKTKAIPNVKNDSVK